MIGPRLSIALAGGLMLFAQAPATLVPIDPGVLSGQAIAETARPYSDYLVRARDAETGQAVGIAPLGPSATFSMDMLPADRPLLVELHSQKDGRIQCVQGPYRLPAAAPVRADVAIDCGKKPAARWLLPASAGLPALMPFATRSVSR